MRIKTPITIFLSCFFPISKMLFAILLLLYSLKIADNYIKKEIQSHKEVKNHQYLISDVG